MPFILLIQVVLLSFAVLLVPKLLFPQLATTRPTYYLSMVERLEHLNSDHQLLPRNFVDDTWMSQELSKVVRNPSILINLCDL